jgi:hypothetical protein
MLYETAADVVLGFDNSLFAFYADVSGKNSELFTAVHSLFSFCRGIATLSVGSVGMALIRKSPPVEMTHYAVAKYQVSMIHLMYCSFTEPRTVSCCLFWRYVIFKWNTCGTLYWP